MQNMEQADKYAKIIWDYMLMNQDLKKSDAIFVLGTHDTRVAEYATNIFLQGYAPWIIFSGGFGKITHGVLNKSEAEVFADIAINLGVPKERVIIENKSSNTGENIIFTQNLLKERNIAVKSLIVVNKPYMERRTYATLKKQWIGVDFILSLHQRFLTKIMGKVMIVSTKILL